MIGFRKKPKDTEHYPRPRRKTYVIGDVHGCIKALELMLEKIMQDADGKDIDLVVIGDMIDRGQDSAAVLNRLQNMPSVICLKGNHEQMALDFLDNPNFAGPFWLKHGGDSTLLSFGLTRIGSMRMEELAQEFRLRLSEDMETWLRELPMYWQSGTLVAAHAGLDPSCLLESQTNEAILWGRSKFLKSPRKDNLWVVHGHWVVPKASISKRRIAIDTGAWRTGLLTAACIEETGIRFIEVEVR